jgi:hypothetical protein
MPRLGDFNRTPARQRVGRTQNTGGRDADEANHLDAAQREKEEPATHFRSKS